MQRRPDTEDDAQKQRKSARTHGAFGLLVFGRRIRVSSIVAVGKIHCSLVPVFLGGPYLSDSESASADQDLDHTPWAGGSGRLFRPPV